MRRGWIGLPPRDWRADGEPPRTRHQSPRAARRGAIAGLLNELGYPTTREHWTPRCERLTREPAVSLFVAEVGGRVAGPAGLRVLTLVERDEPVGRLIALVVGEPFRGRGVRRALVAHVEARARARLV